jgi:predicted ArsR family transcriptional regulator
MSTKKKSTHADGPSSGLLGGSRARLLHELCGQPQTAAELAARVATSTNAVRVHLDGLRVAGLVDYRVERGGVGKPRHIYAITGAAENLLSLAYVPTLSALLTNLRQQLNGGFLPLLREVGTSIGKSRASASNRKSLPAAVAALESLGASVSVKRRSGALHITTRCCPLAAITRDIPEVCNLVESMLGSASGLGVTEECSRGEHPHCNFLIARENP